MIFLLIKTLLNGLRGWNCPFSPFLLKAQGKARKLAINRTFLMEILRYGSFLFVNLDVCELVYEIYLEFDFENAPWRAQLQKSIQEGGFQWMGGFWILDSHDFHEGWFQTQIYSRLCLFLNRKIKKSNSRWISKLDLSL